MERKDTIKMYKLPVEVKFCRNCTVSNQRPRITFDENGVCSACNFAEYKKTKIDWAQREKELKELCDRFRRNDGGYTALASLARRFRCPRVATAHTLDDQTETVVLNLLRGTGPSGLAGMVDRGPWPVSIPGRRPSLLRPLMIFSKKEILRYLQSRGLPFRVDATNALPLFLRNRLRPVLRSWEALRPGFFQRVAQTARILRDEDDFWRTRLASRRKAPRIRLERGPFLRYHVAEQRRRLRHLFGLTRFETLERVRLFAADGSVGPLDIPGGRVAKTGSFLLFRRETP
jgi:tRNA(Ile)-lysidine synthase TilS/MesJ